MRMVSLICSLLVLWLTVVAGESDTSIIARIDGVPIVRSEFEIFLNPWKGTIVHGKGPERDSVRSLFRKALERAIMVKLEKTLAVKAGLISDAGYDTFRDDLRRENDRRRKAKNNNEIVYGPTEFSEQAYYDYQLSNIIIRLKEQLDRQTVDLSEKEIVRTYNLLRDSLFRRNDTIRFLEVRTDSTDGNLDLLRSEVAKTDNPDVLMTTYRCEARIAVVDESTRRLLSEDRPELLSVVSKLRQGELSSWHHDGKFFFLVKCCERKPGGFSPLEEVRGLVRSRLIDAAYEKILRDLRAKANVEIEETMLNKMVEEYLSDRK